MEAGSKKISAIIPTRNRVDEVLRCVASLRCQSQPLYEIIVVDNSDTDVLSDKLGSEVKYLHSPIGTTIARNIGIDNSTGDIIVFVDDDVVLDRYCVETLVKVFENYDRVGGVTAEIDDKSFDGKGNKGMVQWLLAAFGLIRWGDGKFQPSGFPTLIKPGTVKDIVPCEFLHGYCMAFRREVLTQIRPNINLFEGRHGEDDELAYRVSRRYQNYYNPFARGIHLHSMIGRTNYTRRRGQLINHFRVVRKNLPDDFNHRFAFWKAIVGLFVMEVGVSLIRRDTSGLRGLFTGTKCLVKG